MITNLTSIKDMALNINKFNFAQAFNDSKGKTSVTLLSGFLCVIFGLGGFFGSGMTITLMVIFKYEKDANVINFMNMLVMQSLALIGLGTSLLLGHRLSKDKEISKEATEETVTITEEKKNDSTTEIKK